MVERGIPEKIMRNAVQTRWPWESDTGGICNSSQSFQIKKKERVTDIKIGLNFCSVLGKTTFPLVSSQMYSLWCFSQSENVPKYNIFFLEKKVRSLILLRMRADWCDCCCWSCTSWWFWCCWWSFRGCSSMRPHYEFTNNIPLDITGGALE